jgi:chromosome partitioning protein
MMLPGKKKSSCSELVGIAEIAAMVGVSKQVIVNWRARFEDFPAPLADLAATPVFDRSRVEEWLRKRKQKN